MDIEQFIDKTDILLYKKILNLIIKDWDKMDPDRLGQLLDKLRELHTSIDNLIIQRKQNSLFDKEYFISQFDRKKVNEKLHYSSMSLKDIYTELKDNRKRII